MTPGTERTTWLARLLPRPGAERSLAAAALTSSVGQGVFLSCGVIFALRWLGFDATRIGAGMTIGTVFGLAAPVPVGLLVDRVGARRTSVGFAVLAALGVAGFAFVSTFPAYCVAVGLVSGSVVGLGIAQGALIGGLLAGGDRTRFRAYQRSVRNVGLSIGALVAIVPLHLDTRPAYQIALVAGGGCVALSARCTASVETDSRPSRPAGPLVALRDVRFTVMSVLCGLTAVRYSVLTVGLPLWITTRTAAPTQLASITLLLNTAIVVLFQVRAARGADTTRRARGVNLRGSVALGASCVLFGFAETGRAGPAVLLLLIGVVVFTAGEMWTSAAAWTFAFALTKQQLHGQYQATFSLATSLGALGGPALAAFMASGGITGWCFGAAAFVLVGMATAAVVGRGDEVD